MSTVKMSVTPPFFLKLLGSRPVRLRVEPGKAFVIGRASGADFRLEDRLISRRHCELEVRENAVEVRDLGSRNGTCLNGERIQGKALARPGDQIKVGSSFFVVESEVEGPEGPRAAPAPPAQSPAPTPPSPMPIPLSRPAALPSLPGYELVEEIGRGRSGRIYRARRLTDLAEVAVKVLDLAKAASENAVKRFGREARALQRLDHPNIVRIYEVERAAGLHYYVTELVEGATLAERLRERPLGVREALSIAIQVSRALELAHAAGVVHRDVSPETIVTTDGGIAKLFDFGFAKSGEEEGRSLTGLGEIVGDLLYNSPEQIRDPRNVDPRTDLYSLGATLFHTIAGRPPFEGANYLETLRKVLSVPAPRVRDIVPEVPPKVDEIVLRLLAKDPEGRFRTATELVRALEDALLDACSPGPPAAGDRGTFGGAFVGMELVEIVQFLEFTRKDGALVVSAPPLEGEIKFRGGDIVAASAGQLDGEGAIVALLESPGGTFRFRGFAPGERIPDLGLAIKPSAIALAAMRELDERSRSSRRTRRPAR
jgi:hypothetical protein